MKAIFSLLISLVSMQAIANEAVTLTSRYTGGDYNTASYSFRKMSQDINVHGNNIDLLFEGRSDFEDYFTVNTVVDDVGFILDLGEKSCKDLKSGYPEARELSPLVWLAYSQASPSRYAEKSSNALVLKNHCYLVYSNDSEGRIVALFHVRAHETSKQVIVDEIEILDKIEK